MFLGFFASACCLLLVYYVFLRRRKALLRLAWPSSLGYFSFRSRVKKYLLLSGWSIVYQPWFHHDFDATKEGMRVAIQCLPPGVTISSLKLKDWRAFRDYHDLKRPLICVVAESIPPDLDIESKGVEVYFIHYSQLADIVPLIQERRHARQTLQTT